jgi:hypothetical protein
MRHAAPGCVEFAKAQRCQRRGAFRPDPRARHDGNAARGLRLQRHQRGLALCRTRGPARAQHPAKPQRDCQFQRLRRVRAKVDATVKRQVHPLGRTHQPIQQPLVQPAVGQACPQHNARHACRPRGRDIGLHGAGFGLRIDEIPVTRPDHRHDRQTAASGQRHEPGRGRQPAQRQRCAQFDSVCPSRNGFVQARGAVDADLDD